MLQLVRLVAAMAGDEGNTLVLSGRTARPTPGPELAAGTRAAAYVVEELRFSGGHAAVYRARDATSGRPIALKVVGAHLAARADVLERFRLETAALNRLRHPNIVEMLGCGELDDGRPYIAMEWLEGRDLARELGARGPLSPAEALAVLEELGGALSAAHELGIVHRDVKAQNVVALPRDGWFTVKLVDFGIAKMLDPGAAGGTGITTSSVIVGTPLTMAPEQILRATVDARTDIYALGALLFQLVTGRLPFRGATVVELEELHLRAPAPAASAFAPVPPALDAAIARCLEKEKERRFPDVPALVAAVRAAVAAPRPTAGDRAVTALYVEARLDPTVESAADDVADAALADAAALLDAARAALAVAGLEVWADGGTMLLGAALLPAAEADDRAVRARTLDTALELAARLAARPAPSPLVQAAVFVHSARCEVRPGGPPAAGELLDAGAAAPAGGVIASAAALAGIADHFVRSPPSGPAASYRVLGRGTSIP